MQEKNHRRIELFAILALLVISLPSLDFLAKKAFAELQVTIIMPTGGTLSSASDCTLVSRTTNVIWHNCNNVLYAINPVTNVAITSLAVTVSTADRFLGNNGVGDLLYIMSNTGNSVTRYEFDGSTISVNGVFSPATCNFGASFDYDHNGFMWVVCDAEDTILQFNPFTMTEVFRSQDLTDGAGIECDAPTDVHYYHVDGIGVIRCSTTNNIVTFEKATSTSLNLLDSESGFGGTEVIIHGQQDRVIAIDSNTVDVFTYDGGGLLTSTQTINIVGADDCSQEYSESEEKLIVCTDDSGTNTLIPIFLSNVTAVYHIASAFASIDNSQAPLVTTHSGSFSTWYFASSTNDQRIVEVSGLRPIEGTNPEPPSSGEGEDDNNNQVNGVCGNTDTNGDGRVNVLDCVGGNSPFSGITGGRNVTEITALVTNGIGLTACEEDGSDQETCGSGLFTFVMLLLITEFLVLAGYLGLTRITNSSSDIMDIALLLVIMGFVDLAIAFYLNWIPDIIFYTIVVIVAGFLVFGLLKKFGRG